MHMDGLSLIVWLSFYQDKNLDGGKEGRRERKEREGESKTPTNSTTCLDFWARVILIQKSDSRLSVASEYRLLY